MNNNISNNQQQPAKLFENLITYQQLSELIQVPVKTLQDWVYKREIPFKKIGRLVRFSPSEIHAWIDGRSDQYGNNTGQK